MSDDVAVSFDHIMNMSEVSHSVSLSFALHNVFCQAMESLIWLHCIATMAQKIRIFSMFLL